MLLWPELGRGLVQLGHTLVDQSVVLSSHAGFGSSFGSVGCSGNLLLREDGRVPGWAGGDRAGSDLEGENDWTGIGSSWRYGFVPLSLIVERRRANASTVESEPSLPSSCMHEQFFNQIGTSVAPMHATTLRE